MGTSRRETTKAYMIVVGGGLRPLVFVHALHGLRQWYLLLLAPLKFPVVFAESFAADEASVEAASVQELVAVILHCDSHIGIEFLLGHRIDWVVVSDEPH